MLAAVAADPAVRLRQVEVLDAAERAQLLAGWNDTAAAVPAAPVAELVAAQAARTPDAVAVACGDAAGDVRGSWMARAGAAGAGTCGRRGRGRSRWWGCAWTAGPELVAAMLAVWLAGAAYLPLDPGYPAERLAFMLADSRAGGAWPGPAAALEACRPGRVPVVALDDPATRRRWPAAAAGGGRCRAAAGAAGVRDLHVGVDRGAEGRGGDARRAGELRWRGAARLVWGGPGRRAAAVARLAFDLAVTSCAGGAGVRGRRWWWRRRERCRGAGGAGGAGGGSGW